MFYQQFAQRIKDQSIDTSSFPSFDEQRIFCILKQFREEVNDEFKSYNTKNYDIRVNGVRDISHFPLGFCDVIRDRVYQKALEAGIVDELNSKGIVFKKLFGILNNNWFHNVFQIGNYIVDVSRDSIDGFKEYFVATPINSSNFRTINSYDEMFSIMQKYWRVKIYPNILFPEISLYFPYFLEYLDSEVHFKTTHFSIPLFNELQSDFKWTMNFLSKNSNFKFNSHYISKFQRLKKKYAHLFISKDETETLQEYYNRILALRSSNTKEKFDEEMIQKIYRQLNSFNRDLNN